MTRPGIVVDPSSISVVIPTYNSAETIVEALESVLGQTVEVGELIVVDDGSTDSTVDAAMAVSPKVTVVRQKNQGPSAARNRGVQLASGEWIAFLDGDDYWHERKIELQIQELANLDRCDLLAAKWTRGRPPDPKSESELTQIPYVSQLLLNSFQTSTVLMRKSLFETIGGFRSDFDGVEDWHLWLRATEQSPVILSDRVLVHYRNSPGGVSKRLSQFYANMNRMLDEEKLITQIDSVLFDEIRAWHYQRMVIAFVLAKMPSDAVKATLKALNSSTSKANTAAFAHHTFPFLVERARLRLNRAKPN